MKEVTFKSLFTKLFDFKNGIIFSFVLYFIWAIIEIAIPFLTQLVVDQGIFYADFHFILLLVGAIAMFNIGAMLADFSKAWILRNIGVRINIHIIETYYHNLLSKEMTEFNKINEGNVIQNISDNLRIENFLTQSLISFLNSVFTLVIFGIVLFYFDVKIAVIFLISLVILTLWDIAYLKTRAKIDEDRFQMSSKVQNEVIQSVKGIFDIKINNLESYQFELWHKLHQYASRVRLNILKLAQQYGGGNRAISEIRDAVILCLACYAIIKGQMSIGSLLAIQYILGRSRQPIMDLLQVIQDRQDAKLSLQRLQNILKGEAAPAKTHNPTPLEGDLILEQINFHYPNSQKGLENINLHIPKGAKVALVGESGNGKSTLLNVILGLYPPNSGTLYINDSQYKHSVKDCAFGALSQDGYIFNETLCFNVTFEQSNNADLNRLNSVFQQACLSEVIKDLPEKYNTKLGKGGASLSKGQTQRVLIARALYRDSNFLILDEPTSALDNKTALSVVENIIHNYPQKTVLFATHQLILATMMDYVIVMSEGKVIRFIDQTDKKTTVDLKEYIA